MIGTRMTDGVTTQKKVMRVARQLMVNPPTETRQVRKQECSQHFRCCNHFSAGVRTIHWAKFVSRDSVRPRGTRTMKTIVVAIGGNSLIKDEEHRSVPDQYAAVVETARHITDLVESGCRVVITHGDGPQVG